METKSIRKLFARVCTQRGYARLTVGMFLLTAVALTPLAYHVTAGYRAKQEPRLDIKEAGPSALQIFPQTLPLQSRLQYLVEVTDQEGNEHTVASFLYQTPEQMSDNRGAAYADGMFELPDAVKSVNTVRIFLYDNANPRNPVVIPFLEGRISGDRAVLSFVEAHALAAARGSFMLATPTDNNSLINERSGVWFGNVYQNTSLLNLPQPTAGWVYEGWAVIGGRTLTTGRFQRADQKDRFSGFSDTKASSPDFPGEDFLNDPPVAVFPGLAFPVDLSSQTIMITLEPESAGADPSGAGQFPAPILSANVPRLAEAGKVYELENMAESLPQATVVLR